MAVFAWASLVSCVLFEAQYDGWAPLVARRRARHVLERSVRESRANSVDSRDVISCLRKWGHTAIFLNTVGSGVVGSKCKVDVFESGKLRQKISRRSVEVLCDIDSVDAQVPRCRGHELAQPVSPLCASGGWSVGAFRFD